MSDDVIIITMRHLRQVAYCSSGGRLFFERHNLDWSDFLKNGISSDRLAATKDAMAMKVIEAARGQK